MQGFLSELATALTKIKEQLPFTLLLLAILWSIHIINALLGYRFNRWGLYPRRLRGLIGIITSPFLHGNFAHLFFNSIPLFVLVNCVLLQGMHIFIMVTLLIMVIGGGLVWLFGRRAIHIGASGLIMGYFSYLLANAYSQPSAVTVIVVLVCLYYFGSLLLSLFPQEEKVSWEGHLFGFIAGIAANFLLVLH